MAELLDGMMLNTDWHQALAGGKSCGIFVQARECMMVEPSFIATANCTDVVPCITNESNFRCGEQLFIVFDSLLTKSNFPLKISYSKSIVPSPKTRYLISTFRSTFLPPQPHSPRPSPELLPTYLSSSVHWSWVQSLWPCPHLASSTWPILAS